MSGIPRSLTLIYSQVCKDFNHICKVPLLPGRLRPVHMAPWCITQQLMLVERSLYLPHFDLQGSGSTHALGLIPRHETQHFLCNPPGYKPKAPKVPHILTLSQLHKQFSICSGLELPSSHSSSLLKDLGYIVTSLCVIVQKGMFHVLWTMVKLRKGTGLKRPGKIQV